MCAACCTGTVVNHTFFLKNAGNVALIGAVLSTPLTDFSCSPSVPDTWAVGQVLSCSGLHTILQSEVEAGVSALSPVVVEATNIQPTTSRTLYQEFRLKSLPVADRQSISVGINACSPPKHAGKRLDTFRKRSLANHLSLLVRLLIRQSRLPSRPNWCCSLAVTNRFCVVAVRASKAVRRNTLTDVGPALPCILHSHRAECHVC
jgi:hypothetical protein